MKSTGLPRFLLLTAALYGILCGAVRAEIKIIEADSTYVMGDNDSKIDARRIATQEAKRKALGQAGTYIESLTKVQDYRLSQDDIKIYTAGILDTEIVSEQMGGTTEHPEITIRARCTIDTDVLFTQISRYRENEDLKEQLIAAAQENAALKKERDALVSQLATQTNAAKSQVLQKKLGSVLDREEANDAAHRVWVRIGQQLLSPDGDDAGIGQPELEGATTVLRKALEANPRNLRARCLLAALYKRGKDFTAAERELREAVRHNPSNPLPHTKLGDLLREQGRYREALREYHFVERLNPRHPLTLFSVGMTYKELKKCGLSVQYLNRFLKNPAADNFPEKKDAAYRSVEECGGSRPGRLRRGR